MRFLAYFKLKSLSLKFEQNSQMKGEKTPYEIVKPINCFVLRKLSLSFDRWPLVH